MTAIVQCPERDRSASSLDRLALLPADGAIVHPAGIILSVIGALILLFVLQRTGL
jgi:hypothetical protein